MSQLALDTRKKLFLKDPDLIKYYNKQEFAKSLLRGINTVETHNKSWMCIDSNPIKLESVNTVLGSYKSAGFSKINEYIRNNSVGLINKNTSAKIRSIREFDCENAFLFSQKMGVNYNYSLLNLLEKYNHLSKTFTKLSSYEKNALDKLMKFLKIKQNGEIIELNEIEERDAIDNFIKKFQLHTTNCMANLKEFITPDYLKWKEPDMNYKQYIDNIIDNKVGTYANNSDHVLPYKILLMNRYILSMPRYEKDLTVYRYIRPGFISTDEMIMKLTTGDKIIPMTRFNSTGIVPYMQTYDEPEHDIGDMFLKIIIPAGYPFLHFSSLDSASLEGSEIILPYTLDPTGKTLNYGYKLIKHETKKMMDFTTLTGSAELLNVPDHLKKCTNGKLPILVPGDTMITKICVKHFLTVTLTKLEHPIPVYNMPELPKLPSDSAKLNLVLDEALSAIKETSSEFIKQIPKLRQDLHISDDVPLSQEMLKILINKYIKDYNLNSQIGGYEKEYMIAKQKYLYLKSQLK